MTIQPTPDEITYGGMSCMTCPYALAFKRVTGLRYAVYSDEVGLAGLTWHPLPLPVRHWIGAYDSAMFSRNELKDPPAMQWSAERCMT